MPRIENQAAMLALQPPDGWVIAAHPLSYEDIYNQGQQAWEWGNISLTAPRDLSLEQYEAKWKAFLAWAEENELTFAFINDTALRNVDLRFWYGFLFRPINLREERTPEIQAYLEGYELQGQQIERGQILFGDRTLSCDNCRFMGVSRLTFIADSNNLICKTCMRRCRGMTPGGVRCTNMYYGQYFRGCAEHYLREVCGGCEQVREADLLVRLGEGRYCADCTPHICENCNRFVAPPGRLILDDNMAMRICAECVVLFRDMPNALAEQFDDDGDETVAADLLIENHPHRPIRFASIEMEISEGGRPIIQELHRQGLTDYGAVAEYHHGERRAGAGSFCYMERDGSLGETGGELIFSKLALDNQETVEKLHQAIKVVRDHVKQNLAVMDLRCGLHIHVDAHKFGVGHTRNLALLFNFLEDPLYRMSAARYMRHRGYGYAAKLNKRGMDDVQQFGLHFLGHNGHAHALNVSNYWAAMRNNCICGAAIIGRHDKCGCNLGKCTFEFRIYNGTANFRKIHAYTALSMAMVGYARGHMDLDSAEFPELEYEQNRAVNDELKDAWFTRLKWIFENLYFAPNERKSMMYVINNCTLNELGEEKLASLDTIPYRVLRAEEQPVDMTTVRLAQEARPGFIDDDEYYEEDDPGFV